MSKHRNAGLTPFQTVPMSSQKCQRLRFEHPFTSKTSGMTKVVMGAGLEPRGTSCKRHEMSSIKNVWGGVGLRGTYLPEEGEVRVRANRASCNPSRLGLGLG